MIERPKIIQGGMGAGVSNWRLARAVSETGQLGVVSGTALDQILARRLQDGDPGGHMRRGLAGFPFPAMAERIWRTYYVAGGRRDREPYRKLAVHQREDPRELRELCIAANFVEVFLAREGHGNPVGINYLEKVQIPHLPSLYGAMLGGVSYVLMGAGIPLKIPGALDSLARHEPCAYNLPVTGALPGDDNLMQFVPREFMEVDLPPLARPEFLAIIASNVLAATMLKKANGRVDGFVIEGHIAGGHNAPARGKGQLSDAGEPVYGERDYVDLEAIRELGVPFWLAGGYGSPEKLREALDAGAAGIQVGTAFAYCAESGLRDDFKAAILEMVGQGDARVFTDPLASPTGFPFKVVQLEGSLSQQDEYAARPRICDLGYLREAFRTPEGGIDYRCAAEPVPLYVAKGGREENTTGRKCLCNSLLADIGLPQFRNGSRVEGGLVTSGDDLPQVAGFMPRSGTPYHARDVVARLMATVEEEAEEFEICSPLVGVPA
jgi:nitronate monooxygenase